jgi:hypothetical protein
VLKQICGSVERYRQKAGALPADLADLDIVKNQEISVNEKGQPKDAWGNPFAYQIDGENYVVISYGQDGMPGGTGDDADLRSDQDPDFVKMSLWEFTTAERTIGMKFCCVLGGVFAFPIFLIQSRPAHSRLFRVLAVHLITAIFAVGVAVLMSLLHLPTGH